MEHAGDGLLIEYFGDIRVSMNKMNLSAQAGIIYFQLLL
jgi:hypothetical protein